MARASVGAGLESRRNALNLVRLVLAILVIVAHTFPLGGHGASLDRVSGLAVDGFFALSGYLITGSRMRLSLGRFYWHRALRILPGFWVCLVVTGLVLAPVTAVLTDESWQLRDGLGYVTNNAALGIVQYGVGDTLASVPYPHVWNGSLWTLWYEALAYLVAGLLLTLGTVRRHLTLVLPTMLVGATVVLPLSHASVMASGLLAFAPRLGAYFVAGMTLWAFRDRLPVTPALVGAAGLLVAAGLFVDPVVSTMATPLPLAYLLLAVGTSRRVGAGVRTDLSYGVYIYAFSVQQVLAVLGAQRWGVIGMFLIATGITLPVAWLSWTFVEQPALRFKNLDMSPGSRRAALLTGAGSP